MSETQGPIRGSVLYKIGYIDKLDVLFQCIRHCVRGAATAMLTKGNADLRAVDEPAVSLMHAEGCI